MADGALIQEQILEEKNKINGLLAMVGQRLVGQEHVARRLVMGLIAEGHVLLEGLPGLAKTTAVKALGDSSDLKVSRIQFTPDLLPADIIGTQIYDPRTGEFNVKQGPIFANLVIADEINRAPAKVQSALLEAMQEKQVTLGDRTYRLTQPFLVMATQNPIEQEGTYTLPEAQTDRFLFKVKVTYLTPQDERLMMERLACSREIPVDRAISGDDILRIRSLVDQVIVSDKLRDYILKIVFATRFPQEYGLKELQGLISYGGSPRASLALEKASRVGALMEGRSFVSPQDVKDVAFDILRHRILVSYEAEAENLDADYMIGKILENIDVP